jgi:pyruvate dehydrogenase E1 component
MSPKTAVPARAHTPPRASRLETLRALERKVLWLSSWTIHHANHVRPKLDGLKVGGHQASSASLATLMTALYFDVLKPWDRVAVKPHASPVFHAIQYLFGKQSRQDLERFRSLGGAQSYPSRTKDHDDVDFSTGSVGLGVAITAFEALVEEYLRARDWMPAGQPPGRMVALLGDAEFDEGNIFEAMLEAWKHDIRNTWWIVDYNRQSLDAVASDRLYDRFASTFRDLEWDVVTLKYGKQLEAAFKEKGGGALKQWIDDCSNIDYTVLANKDGAAWRERLLKDIGNASGVKQLLDSRDDATLRALMTNLGGHDLESILEAFHGVTSDRPTVFIAYTIKGRGLPFAAHKDNHAGLMTPDQMAGFRAEMGIAEGQEWEPFAGFDIPEADIRKALDEAPFNQGGSRRHTAPKVPVPATIESPTATTLSTQEGFGRIMATIGRSHPELADRIVTTAPDVATSTNLGTWVNRRGVYDRRERGDAFADAQVVSPQKWAVGPKGQHIELGIAENNLFIMLGALGLSGSLFNQRLLPIGTVYDPFICRGLDALNYACYQDARFILVATPSGLTLAPEGGAHQSIITPLIGISQPGLTLFEPAYIDELTEMLRWSFEHMQAEDGGSIYLRLSTRGLAQPQREMTDQLRQDILEGAYWLKPPSEGSDLALVVCGPVIPEALDAHAQLLEDAPGAGLLMVTSPSRLYKGWQAAQKDPRRSNGPSHIERMLGTLSPDAGLVTVLDGHPATLSWIGAVRRQRIVSLGVDRFGQSGNIPDLYRIYGLDADAMVDAAARVLVS